MWVNQHPFIGSERILILALRQGVKVDTGKASGRPPARLQVVRAGALMRTQLPETNTAGVSDPYAGRVETSFILG
jgi:hypothetical protein